MRLRRLLLFLVFFTTSWTQSFARSSEPLPEAPSPSYQDGTTNQKDTQFEYRKYVDPGQPAPSLTSKQKILFAFREQVKPWSFATPFLSAGWGHLIDSNPHYGSDKAGFGERLGAAALRQSSQAILSDGFAAAAFHQDPRFYRLGKEHPIRRRIIYAASRVIVGRKDEGGAMPNYAQLTGYAGAAALTMTYYPASSAKWGEVWQGYGISLSTAAAGNLIHEFGPDILHRFLKQKQ